MGAKARLTEGTTGHIPNPGRTNKIKPLQVAKIWSWNTFLDYPSYPIKENNSGTDRLEPGQIFDSIEILLKFTLSNMLKHLVLALKSDFQGRTESPNRE